MVKKLILLLSGIIIFCCISFWAFIQYSLFSSPPEKITKDLYLWYSSCLTKHIHDTISLSKTCPFTATHGLSDTFTRSIISAYDDPILCNEGVPEKISFFKPYYDTKNKVSIIVSINVKNGELHIPVRLQQINSQWKITAIDCELDGHID